LVFTAGQYEIHLFVIHLDFFDATHTWSSLSAFVCQHSVVAVVAVVAAVAVRPGDSPGVFEL
jgi:hypothetical protein